MMCIIDIFLQCVNICSQLQPIPGIWQSFLNHRLNVPNGTTGNAFVSVEECQSVEIQFCCSLFDVIIVVIQYFKGDV